ncbi:MAG: acyltransferase [Roseivirga sp.]|nr:acyltransferase [Roseivirga sp.]
MKSINSLLSGFNRETSSGKYIPFVDGLRFLAIMPVIIQHASERLLKYNPQIEIQSGMEQQAEFLVSRGAIGVIIFFTLSGFILSLPFAKSGSGFSYKRYLGRRLTRLEPPFIFWMSCFALVLVIRSSLPLSTVGEHWLSSIFYLHTIVYQEFSIINPVAWSLEVEIQYYLLAPFMAILYFNQPDKLFRRAFLIVFMLVFLIYQHALGWNMFPVKASLLGHLHHFLIGMLMADLYKNDTQWVAEKMIIWDLIAPICLLMMAHTWTEEFVKTLIMNIALAGLFIAAIMHELFFSLFGDFGQSTPWWVQLSISLLITLPLVLLSSMIGFKLIEQPFMKRKSLTKIRSLFRLPILKKHPFLNKQL